MKRVHRMVAEVFVAGRGPEAEEVNHLDGDKTNNAAANLEWCDRPRNMSHYVDLALSKGTYKNSMSKLNAESVAKAREMRKSGMTQKQIGEQLGVGRHTIGCVLRGQTWKHVQ